MSERQPGDTDSEQINSAILERFFLIRLQRFARLAVTADSTQIPQWKRLARHATLSAYRDCIALDLKKDARAVLERTLGQRSLSG